MPEEEWIKRLEDGRNVKFIYQELPETEHLLLRRLRKMRSFIRCY
jgi:hypothetical protein